ncbi:CBS domain-containing protein [Pseudazoarcus pumilus]|nr:CBS domain-containing protein [Pseudazoarcus pumilus]
MANFHAIGVSVLTGKTRLVTQPETRPLDHMLDEPALSAMTDLSRVPAASVSADELVDDAHARMLERRVRMLFVVDHAGFLAGLITSNDLLGEKPMQVVRERGVRHDEIRVQDIMTPAEAVEALDIDDLGGARVGDIVETMRSRARQHALVVRHDAEGLPQVCGVFSAADLSRRLGIEVVPMKVARTFAEIEESLAHE